MDSGSGLCDFFARRLKGFKRIFAFSLSPEVSGLKASLISSSQVYFCLYKVGFCVSEWVKTYKSYKFFLIWIAEVDCVRLLRQFEQSSRV